MNPATTELPLAPNPAPAKKKSRPNPARRKTAKANFEKPEVKVEPTSVKSVSSTSPRGTQGSNNASKRNQTKQPSAMKKVSTSATEAASTHKPALCVNTKTKHSSNPTQSNKSVHESDESKSFALAPPAFITGGLVGCAAGAAVVLGAGLWRNLAGPESAILAARTAKMCVDNLTEEIITSLRTGTYNAPEALDVLRRTTLAYASAIPGGASFVERIFCEIEMVRKQRGREVDKAIAEASVDLSNAGHRAAGSDELQSIVLQNVMKLSRFAQNASQDVFARNPSWQPYRESAVKALKPASTPKVSTIKLNMAVQHKKSTPAR